MKKIILLSLLIINFIPENSFAQNIHAKYLQKKLEHDMKVKKTQIDSFVIIQTEFENNERKLKLNHQMKQIEKERQMANLIKKRNSRLQKNTLTTQQYNQVLEILTTLKKK